jgi:hypothetical protein
MAWSTVPFGKYAGKTLPEIIVRDLDWFFWVVPKLYGKLAEEAEELARRARAIKIPNSRRKRLEVEYRYEDGNRFCGFAFVKASSVRYSRWATRLPYLDLSWPLRRKKYDKARRPHPDTGFSDSLFWGAQTIDQRALRRVFQQ